MGRELPRLQLRLSGRTWSGRTYDRRNEPVTASRDRLHEAGVLGSIAEDFPQPHDRVVQSVVKIDKGIPWPEAIAQFFAGDNFARLFQKQDQNLKGLFGELESETVLAELASFQIRFKHTEMQNSRNRCGATHGSGSEYSSPSALGSKSERQNSILFVFKHKAKDAEMFTIGQIKHCTEALMRCRLSPRRKQHFARTAEILLRGAAQSHFQTTKRGQRQ